MQSTARLAALLSIFALTGTLRGERSQPADSPPGVLLLASPAGDRESAPWRHAADALPHDAMVVFGETADPGDPLAPGGVASLGWIDVVRLPGALVGEPDTLAPLRRALEGARAPSVLLAIDRAAWAAGRRDWDQAHDLLVEDGRVVGVCAVGEGLLRDDGERDGIRYFAIPFADRAGPDGLELFGGPALVLLSLGGDGVELTRVDPAGVRGFDPGAGEALDDVLAAGRGLSIEGRLRAPLDGGSAGSVAVVLENPTGRAVGFSLALRAPSGWSFTPSRLEGTIPAGETFRATVAGTAPGIESEPEIRVVGVVRVPVGESDVQGVGVSARVPLTPALGEPSSQAGGVDRALRLDGRSGVRIELPALGPAYTVEAWVRADGEQSDAVLWSGDGMLVRWIGPESDGPVPTAALTDDAGGRRTLSGAGEAPREEWTHIALCVGPESAALFVDGERVGASDAGFAPLGPGVLTLGGVGRAYAGVDSGFRGMLDSVRVSGTLRYAGPFTPVREFAPDDATVALFGFREDLGPVFRDESSRSSHAWASGGGVGARAVPVPQGP
ncbi:MAG: LamG-like jellyroll fold domain-containing protein [Phycisphaerales bacterium JB040]